MCKRGYAWKAAKCTFKNSKYLDSIIDDSMIIHDEIIETTKGNLTKTALTKSTPTDFNKKMRFLIIFTTCLKIHCCIIKYQQNKKEVNIKNILQKWKVLN